MTSSGALPVGPVKIGDAWDGTGASEALGMQMKQLSTLTGMDSAPTGTVADIGQTYHGTFKVGIGGPQMPIQMTGLLSGTGQMHFDTDVGAVADSASALTEEMTMALPPSVLKSAPASTPKTIHMHLTMRMKMQRLSYTPPPTPAP